MNSHSHAPSNPFFAQAMGLMTPIHADNMDAFAQPEGGLAVMKAIAEMVRTGTSPLSDDEMLEPIAVAQAGRKSHNTPNAVDLSSLR